MFRTMAAAGAVAVAVAGGTLAAGSEAPLRGADTPITAEPCFGAPAHDAKAPCRNPRLKLAVVPTPEDAVLQPNSPCTPEQQDGLLLICRFGEQAPEPTLGVALIGDSHASHWRAGLIDVASSQRWLARSITRSSCPFSAATPTIPEPARGKCISWNKQLIAWFKRHREVSTVFISQHAGADVVRPAGASRTETMIAAYQAAWKALPASVRHIIILRDTPLRRLRTLDCIERSLATRRPAGTSCAVNRSIALKPDPAVIAAKRLNSPRVQIIDTSRFTCSARLCLPVVGGALVNKDVNHMTVTYAESLAPYLEAKTKSLMLEWQGTDVRPKAAPLTAP